MAITMSSLSILLCPSVFLNPIQLQSAMQTCLVIFMFLAQTSLVENWFITDYTDLYIHSAIKLISIIKRQINYVDQIVWLKQCLKGNTLTEKVSKLDTKFTILLS